MTTVTAELSPYPLALRQLTNPDCERIRAVTRESGYIEKDWPYLAVAELARYRYAMLAYRDALVELGELPPLPPAAEIWAE